MIPAYDIANLTSLATSNPESDIGKQFFALAGVTDSELCAALEKEMKKSDGNCPSREMRVAIALAADRIDTRAEARDVLRRMKNVKVDSSPRDTQQKP